MQGTRSSHPSHPHVTTLHDWTGRHPKHESSGPGTANGIRTTAHSHNLQVPFEQHGRYLSNTYAPSVEQIPPAPTRWTRSAFLGSAGVSIPFDLPIGRVQKMSGPKDARSPRALLGIRGTASES